MFGLGMGEILVIVVVALLVLGPEKLPDATKKISEGIRSFRKQSRELQQTIEQDTQIGGAIRDLKSAMRGEDLPYVPPHLKDRPQPMSADDMDGTEDEDSAPIDAPTLNTLHSAPEPDEEPMPIPQPPQGAVAHGDSVETEEPLEAAGDSDGRA